MPRTRRRHPNWPYRLAWLGMWLVLLTYVGLQTVSHALSMGRRSYGIDWSLAFVASLFDATIAIYFFVVGACIGSFLNVVAYRLPLGRYIGGHSGCPYCQTPIDAVDNIPILAWIKLRGRCRTCRLPISPQYPLVELAVALVFLFVYVTEFAAGGSNLPGVESLSSRGGMMRVAITPRLCLQLFAYLFLLSSLIAAALIALKNRRVPLRLYAWGVAPLVICSLAQPEIVVVPWRISTGLGPIEARFDAFVTLMCGAVVATIIARGLAPLLYPGFDRSLISGDASTTGARQFIGALAVVGSSVGWQASLPLVWCVMLAALLGTALVKRARAAFPLRSTRWQLAQLSDLTVWTWLGTLVFRANWATLVHWQWLPSGIPDAIRYTLGALLLAPLAWLAHRRNRTSPELEPEEEAEQEPQNPQNQPN